MLGSEGLGVMLDRNSGGGFLNFLLLISVYIPVSLASKCMYSVAEPLMITSPSCRNTHENAGPHHPDCGCRAPLQ